jgi:hypothetical protein
MPYHGERSVDSCACDRCGIACDPDSRNISLQFRKSYLRTFQTVLRAQFQLFTRCSPLGESFLRTSAGTDNQATDQSVWLTIGPRTLAEHIKLHVQALRGLVDELVGVAGEDDAIHQGINQFLDELLVDAGGGSWRSPHASPIARLPHAGQTRP